MNTYPCGSPSPREARYMELRCASSHYQHAGMREIMIYEYGMLRIGDGSLDL